jgi:CheY-like chemotaxis protein
VIDRSQLVTALVNLAINARDAMPGGGRVLIETGNVILDDSYARVNADVRPGRYVMIAVSDTGCGIPAAIRDKVFEPFFTTKEVGKGTGLGLSMVYGFIKQSGGHLKIYSEDGHGTTIRLYLPQATGQSQPIVEQRAAATAPANGNARILVVEDDRLVRDYVVAQLGALGYTVAAAAGAAEALAMLEGGVAADLLFTDVIMPGPMSGRHLADRARERRPDLKVLFTSGYTEHAIVQHGRLDAGVLLLAKPYRKSDLARMIRVALAEPSRPAVAR